MKVQVKLKTGQMVGGQKKEILNLEIKTSLAKYGARTFLKMAKMLLHKSSNKTNFSHVRILVPIFGTYNKSMRGSKTLSDIIFQIQLKC